MRKKVLVCGASGFLGNHVFSELSGHPDLEVKGTFLTNRYNRIDPNDRRLIKADLTCKETVKSLISEEWDIIVQMAANSSGAKDIVERPYIHITDNVIMNALLFQTAHDHHVNHVIFPSCTVMYPNSDRLLKETDIDLNLGFYPKYFGGAWMKVYCEKLCEFYSRLGHTRYTIIRHSNIYGPNDRFDPERSHVCGANINRVMRARDNDKIVVWGEGTETRDFLFVDDLVDFIRLVIARQDYSFDIFNVGYGISFTVKEWIEKIIRRSGKSLTIEFDSAKPTIYTRISLDISKARNKFGWTAKVSPDIGLSKTISWFLANILNRPC